MKAILFSLCLLIVPGTALAGKGGDGADKAGKRAGPHREHLQQELGVTEEQREQMREIRKKGGSREEMNAVLTPEQQAKSAALRKNKRGNHAKRMQKLQEPLGLSDEQLAKMQTIQAEGGGRKEIYAVLNAEQQAKYKGLRGKHDAEKSAEKAARKAAKKSAKKPAE